ncbi:MFS general substrate transporter [Penicillium coprophilum]|uniref:MFS general substrate transporter n=1 Tax=Penicillium coprophilum TaxID=36646 RepID=UPI0023A299E3|nr:MFS general substrate transporter [Penicillium coprophilum]KAJ5164334.1 MFS general substrate transporter [Penicillium coprophilum]
MSTIRAVHDEREPTVATPLLQDHIHGIPQQKWRENSDTRALVICAIFIFVISSASSLQLAPTNQLLELSVCRSYYSSTDPGIFSQDGSFSGEVCKIHEIQSEVAIWRGWLGLAQAAPGLLLAVPYGILAQSTGRKLVVTLGLTGEIIGAIWIWVACHYLERLSIWVMVLSASIWCIGGGSSVMSSMVLAMVATFTSPRSRYHLNSRLKTRAFFYMSVVIMVSELLSAPLSSFLMSQYGPHIPFLLGIPLEISGYLTLYLLPNPDMLKSDPRSMDGGECEARASLPAKTQFAGVAQLKEICSFVLSQPALIMLLFALMVNKVTRQIEELIVQYTRVRYGWTIPQSGYLLSLVAATHIFLSCSVLPWAHRSLLARNEGNVAQADLVMAKASGLLILILTQGLLLFLSGSGFRPAVQSYITSAVPPGDITLLYASLSVVDALGSLSAAPLLGYMLAVGIQIGGMALGLPFFLSSILYGVSALGVWRAHINVT